MPLIFRWDLINTQMEGYQTRGRHVSLFQFHVTPTSVSKSRLQVSSFKAIFVWVWDSSSYRTWVRSSKRTQGKICQIFFQLIFLTAVFILYPISLRFCISESHVHMTNWGTENRSTSYNSKIVRTNLWKCKAMIKMAHNPRFGREQAEPKRRTRYNTRQILLQCRLRHSLI